MAQEDYTFGCRREGVIVPKDVSRKSVLLFQCGQFLKAFRRRIDIKKNPDFPKDCVIVLNRLEDFIAGNFQKRKLPVSDKSYLNTILEAFNDLSETVNFYISVVIPEKVRYLAFRDALTDVYNRHYLMEYLNLLEDQKDLFPIGIIFVDMDDLKKINDTFGHKVGDFYIVKVAEAIKLSVRSNDKVFRIGGDEFIILVSRANEDILEKIIERIQKRIDKINEMEKLSPPLSVSIGYSIWKSHDVPFQEALEEADSNMYRKKKD